MTTYCMRCEIRPRLGGQSRCLHCCGLSVEGRAYMQHLPPAIASAIVDRLRTVGLDLTTVDIAAVRAVHKAMPWAHGPTSTRWSPPPHNIPRKKGL